MKVLLFSSSDDVVFRKEKKYTKYIIEVDEAGFHCDIALFALLYNSISVFHFQDFIQRVTFDGTLQSWNPAITTKLFSNHTLLSMNQFKLLFVFFDSKNINWKMFWHFAG